MTQIVSVRLEHAAASQQPGPREGIVDLEGRELIPVIVAGIDLGLVGPGQCAAELEIIRRVGENDVD